MTAYMLRLEIYREDMQPDVDDLCETCFSELGWKYEREGRHADLQHIPEKYMKNGCFWCLYDDNYLVGIVAVWTIDEENKIAEIKRLYVPEEFHGNGYGRFLFDTALRFAAENGFNKVRADTGRDRVRSQHLMRSRGFTEIPRYNDNYVAELFFERVLRD